MYAESEVENGVDFIPGDLILERGFLKLCRRCRYWNVGCPMFYKCPTIKRWENADLDDDDTYY